MAYFAPPLGSPLFPLGQMRGKVVTDGTMSIIVINNIKKNFIFLETKKEFIIQ
jgi:hypothetical protein